MLEPTHFNEVLEKFNCFNVDDARETENYNFEHKDTRNIASITI